MYIYIHNEKKIDHFVFANVLKQVASNQEAF